MPTVPGVVAGISSQAGNIAALAGGPVAAAMKLFTDGLTGATAGMEDFVKALSPVTLEIFNDAIGDLMATIGQALLPVIEVFTGVIRTVADAISPLMQALAPILRQLAEIVGTLLIGAVNALVGVIYAVASAFGGAEDGLKDFKTAIQNFVRMMLRGLAYLIKAFAGVQPLEKWAKALEEGTRAKAAPSDIAIKGLGQIASDMATKAFIAGGTGAESTEDMQAAIAKDVREIASNAKTFQDWLRGEFLVFVKLMLKQLWQELKDTKTGHAISGAAFGPVGLLPEIGEIAGRIWEHGPGDLWE